MIHQFVRGGEANLALLTPVAHPLLPLHGLELGKGLRINVLFFHGLSFSLLNHGTFDRRTALITITLGTAITAFFALMLLNSLVLILLVLLMLLLLIMMRLHIKSIRRCSSRILERISRTDLGMVDEKLIVVEEESTFLAGQGVIRGSTIKWTWRRHVH